MSAFANSKSALRSASTMFSLRPEVVDADDVVPVRQQAIYQR
jgi:hypothetical protein